MKPKVLIMSGYGINCEHETAYAFEMIGGDAEVVHINDLISKKKKMSDYQIMVFPGGFSYGDDTGAGNAYANKIRNNLWKELMEFVDSGKLILGICNGFQIISELGLFSDEGKKINALLPNTNNRYTCVWVNLKHNNSKCVFTKDINELYLPIAHGEGRFYCDSATLEKLKMNNQIVFTYDENPNGSLADVAGVCDKTGRIMGMMPHPERSLYTFSQPDFHLKKEIAKRKGEKLPEINESCLKIFKNAVEFFKK
ncbi:phosphoribosylformylglycinamidine synthase I [Candidatus Woesearchaeota archaeon]|nr:phosphoribosylformylglycinamidine synthase I [Candidatus Woesearchaeota archaeon]